MKIQIYCKKDNVSGFLMPQFDMYEASAVRNFSFEVSEHNLMNFKPEDYSFWHIGEYDTETGVITGCDPQLLVHATEVIKK